MQNVDMGVATEAYRCYKITTYMSSSRETLFNERHLLLHNSRKYTSLLTCFYIFVDDLSRVVHILSLCQEPRTFHVSYSILK